MWLEEVDVARHDRPSALVANICWVNGGDKYIPA